MADVNLTVTIPDAYVSRVIDAVSGQADKSPRVEVTYIPKQGGETNADFGKRFLKHQQINKNNGNPILIPPRC